MEALPNHLKRYVVEQNYEKYTPVEQASWRYVLRQLKAYLSVHAHECYQQGLEKTGIEIERIPRISDISAKLEKFGWRALPVSGFIPPAAFMELQALGVLPIASDMRTLEHLAYTPAPDIVHEAAGHAPILVHPEFADYLRQYAQVAKKAILSKEDLDLYEAIRHLSDLKEKHDAAPEEIREAEERLAAVSKSIVHVSEAAELGRMNWWTAEYGLIGDLKHPKIFGAGLLSSVGEAKWCLSDKVGKIPLTVNCIQQSYDITEPQPQLFVTPDFKTLVRVLEEMASQMAFRRGGLYGLKKVIEARSVNTVELNSGLQISGQVVEAITSPQGEVIYLRLQGPSQLSYKDQELPGHGKDYHAHGFGTPVGRLVKFPKIDPSALTTEQWASFGQNMDLEFTSGVRVHGTLQGRLEKDGRTLLLTLTNAKATYQDRVLFDPSWGTFDMALGSEIPSVFGGPADRKAYGETQDFVAARVPVRKYSEREKTFHKQYADVRELREKKISGADLEKALTALLKIHDDLFPEDWLLRLEMYELTLNRAASSSLKEVLKKSLERLQNTQATQAPMIHEGLKLAGAI